MAVEVQKEGRKKSKGGSGQSGKKAGGAGGDGGGEKRVTPKSEDFSRCAARPAAQGSCARALVCDGDTQRSLSEHGRCGCASGAGAGFSTTAYSCAAVQVVPGPGTGGRAGRLWACARDNGHPALRLRAVGGHPGMQALPPLAPLSSGLTCSMLIALDGPVVCADICCMFPAAELLRFWNAQLRVLSCSLGQSPEERQGPRVSGTLAKRVTRSGRPAGRPGPALQGGGRAERILPAAHPAVLPAEGGGPCGGLCARARAGHARRAPMQRAPVHAHIRRPCCGMRADPAVASARELSACTHSPCCRLRAKPAVASARELSACTSSLPLLREEADSAVASARGLARATLGAPLGPSAHPMAVACVHLRRYSCVGRRTIPQAPATGGGLHAPSCRLQA